MNNISALYSSTPPSGSSRFSYPSAPSTNSTTSLQNSTTATSIRSASQPHPPSLQQQLFGSAAHASPGILDRPLNKTRGAEVGLNAFAFLLAEIVSYSQSRVDSVTDLERRRVHYISLCIIVSKVAELACSLSALGYDAGSRILSLTLLRNTQLAGGKVYPLASELDSS